MADASIDELKAFASYQRRWSSEPQARAATKVLALADSCGTPDDILSMLRNDEPGDVRDEAIGFVCHFRVPVRDECVDAVMAVRRLREFGLAVGSEAQELAEAANLKEICLAALISEAEIRDAVRGMVAGLNAKDEASGRAPFSWLSSSDEEPEG